MHGFGGMGFGMGWWWIIGIILMAAIIWAIVRSFGQSNNLNNTANQKSALDILNERYARGEIEKEEFETKKRDLGK
ncbi:MAG: SHOCT domain-containing protein [Bacteroidales bacterium]|jgi:putative membrane protein|nr:SHOCT domain-containing protein [Bacteroidales bacterium]